MNKQKRLKRKLSKVLFHYQWQLLFDLNDSISERINEFKKIISSNDRFWADPFIIFTDNKYYIFFEEFIYKKNKGHISFFIIDQKGDLSKPQTILTRPYHLSYPFVFNYDKEYYMIPESSENNTIEVYKCLEFPQKWEFYKILMNNVVATDSTLFYYDNKWWLFTTIMTKKNESELCLFYSDHPLSEKWIPHPKNPIVSGNKGSRSAGRIFEENGIIKRPAQDSSKGYGYGVIFYQINTINETDYQESEINSIYPDWNKNIIGIHTFARVNKLTMMDMRIKKLRLWNNFFKIYVKLTKV